MAKAVIRKGEFDVGRYAYNLGRETERLEGTSQTISSGIIEREQRLTTISKSMKEELEELKEGIQKHKEGLALYKEVLIALLHKYKKGARKEEFAKLDQQVDDFGFENLITRSEFKRWLKEHSSKP